MATKRRQRIGILIIMIVLVAGTLGSFLVMILSTHSSQQAAERFQKAQAAYQKESEAHQKLVDAQGDKLSTQYYSGFKQYADQPAKYDIDSIKSLTKRDLKVGSGETISDETKFAVYYIGWDADGKIFDQSIGDGKLKAPFSIDGLKDTAVIDGWKEGLVGMKIGGVRLLEIPSDKAYGEAGSTDGNGNVTIAPNMPLKFIVMAIAAPEEIPESEAFLRASEEYQSAMIQYYTTQ